MKKLNIKKAPREILVKKLEKIIHLQNGAEKYLDLGLHFDNLVGYDIREELNRRNRAAIFKEACWCIENDGWNQFYAAACYADSVLDNCNYFSDADHWEIGEFETKKGLGAVVVWFD